MKMKKMKEMKKSKASTCSSMRLFAPSLVAFSTSFLALASCGGGGNAGGTSSTSSSGGANTGSSSGSTSSGGSSGASSSCAAGAGIAVTYDANGATGGTVPVDSTCHPTGATVTVLGNTGNLAYSGYTFLGWQTVADGSGKPYAPGSTFALGSASVTLYALWAGGYAYAVNHNEGAEGAISQFSIGANGALTPMFTPTIDSGGQDTRAVAVDPQGRYVYALNPAANNHTGSVTQFAIDQSNGSLSPLTPVTASPPSDNFAPTGGVVHPTSNWLYVTGTNENAGAVTQFTLGATGTLASPSVVAVGDDPTQTGPYAVAIDPTGRYAYVAGTCCGAGNGAVFEYTVDGTSGALQANPSDAGSSVPTTPVTSLGWAQPSDIEVLQIGSAEYAYVTNEDDGTVWEFSVDADGTLASIGSFLVAPTATVCTCDTSGGNNIAAMDIALHPSGRYAYATFSCCSSQQSVAQFTIDQSSGLFSPMTPPTVASSGSSSSIAVEASGKFAYVTSGDTGFADSAIAQYTIDQTTGALTLMANPTVQTGAIGPSGIVTVGK